MNTQLLIQQLKQLPRVGQGGSQSGASQYGGNQAGSGGSGQTTAGDISDAMSDLTAAAMALITTAGITTVEETFNTLSTQISNVTQQVDLFGEKLKLSVAASGQLSTGFAQVAQKTENFLLTTQEVNQGAIALDQQVRGVGRAMKDVTSETDNAAVFVARLSTGFGLTNEEAATLAKSGLAYTGNVKEFNTELTRTAMALEKAYKAQDAYAVITKEISATNALTRGYIGDQTQQLATAAFHANRYGLSINDAFAAGKKTLDIESSIAAEMELMALTGRSIVDSSGENLIQKMREATATGDIVTLQEAQRDLAENYSDIIQDPLLSNSLFNLSGLTEEQLANLNETNKAIKAGLDLAEEQGVAPEALAPRGMVKMSELDFKDITPEQSVQYAREVAAITTPEQIERTGQEFRTITEASGQAAGTAIALNEQAQNLQGGIRSTEDMGIVEVIRQLTTTLQGSKPMTAQELAAATRSGINGATITVVLSETGTGTGTISTLNSTGATATGP
jgi:hypothetical protein